MNIKKTRTLVVVGFLIILTGIAMAFAGRMNPEKNITSHNGGIASDQHLDVTAKLVQDKVFYGSDGIVSLAVTIKAKKESRNPEKKRVNPVDMVIVLDQSGSMGGRKIADAKKAILNLYDTLGEKDRFSLVTYSDHVQALSGLDWVTHENRRHLHAAINHIHASGGTNLGSGLLQGIQQIDNQMGSENLKKIILISDGLANQGITSVDALGRIASKGFEKGYTTSTVGVGMDFNEELMTHIADQGTGSYHFMENPNAFAKIFVKEYRNLQAAAATGIKISMSRSNDVTLVDAAGYPLTTTGNRSFFLPGDIRMGQTRTFYLTLKVPTDKTRNIKMPEFHVEYTSAGNANTISFNDPFYIACVKNKAAVLASIKKDIWADKVIKRDYGKLKEQVAKDLKEGKKGSAMARISAYKSRQQAVNRVVKSQAVSGNIERDVTELEDRVNDTFMGSPSVVMEKQKKNAKALQYEGYINQRSK